MEYFVPISSHSDLITCPWIKFEPTNIMYEFDGLAVVSEDVFKKYIYIVDVKGKKYGAKVVPLNHSLTNQKKNKNNDGKQR